MTNGKVIEQTPLPIPDELWRQINPKYTQAALFENLINIIFFGDTVAEPTSVYKENLNYWVPPSGRFFTIKAKDFNINTDGIDWRLSLTKRPEGL